MDLAYLGAATLASPVWLSRMASRGKLRTDWRGRLGYIHDVPPRDDRPRLLVHAVSVGEVNAIRLLVDQLRGGDQPVDVFIATTTDTGTRRASELFGPGPSGRGHGLVRYPFDFSVCVDRLLDAVQPDAAALVELEVWPNFIASCEARGIPVAVINGRLSARSFGRYRMARPILRRTFARLAAVAAQDDAYAERFRAMGVPAERVEVLGTMKWDTAEIIDSVDGAEQLALELGIDRTRPLVVAGSTAPGEHELLVAATPADVQLLCAPRKPEWFDDAARVLKGCVRRSRGPTAARTGGSSRYLLDTIGELRKAYALADVVVVGRTFVPLGGSNMIEPVGLGKPTVVGPHVENFLDANAALVDGGGIVPAEAGSLGLILRDLLQSPSRRAEVAERGRAVIRQRQGATERTAALLRRLVGRS